MYIFYFSNILRLITIVIVQTMMSVTTLYLIPFSSYMQKTKHVFGSCATVLPKNRTVLVKDLLVLRKNTSARTENMFGFLHIT